ncbi:MAG: hypothetical protein NUV67_01920 [archaeon]|nr:hypothetical protein [archaeon]
MGIAKLFHGVKSAAKNSRIVWRAFGPRLAKRGVRALRGEIRFAQTHAELDSLLARLEIFKKESWVPGAVAKEFQAEIEKRKSEIESEDASGDAQMHEVGRAAGSRMRTDWPLTPAEMTAQIIQKARQKDRAGTRAKKRPVQSSPVQSKSGEHRRRHRGQ